jgi:hypothetical protein
MNTEEHLTIGQATDKLDEVEAALNKLVDAWEALPGGRNYHPRDIERWLRDRMSLAINNARKVLGRPIKRIQQ